MQLWRESTARKEGLCPALIAATMNFEAILLHADMDKQSVDAHMKCAERKNMKYAFLGISEHGTCSGSKCMMWNYTENKDEYNDNDLGYCGMNRRA